jgi:hypothetical protein
MSESDSLSSHDDLPPREGPTTPDEDETFGAEPDDHRAAGRFEDVYAVADFDPAYEQRDMCSEEASADG